MVCVLAGIVALPAAAAGQADAPAAQDVLVFTNGDRLTGRLVRGVKDTIVFHSDVVGDVTIPLAKVRELQTHGSFAVLRKGAPVSVSEQVQPEPIAISNANVLLQPVQGPVPPAIPLADVAYLVDGSTFQKNLLHKPGPLQGWGGTVTAGATFIQSTQHGGSFNTAANFVRQVPLLTFLRARNKTIFNLQETFGTLTTPVIPQTTPPSSDDVVKTSVFHADVERDEYFKPKGYALASAAFDHNFSQGLQLQQTYGVGLGYTARSSPGQRLDLKADVHYEKQEFFLPSENLNLVGATLAEIYHAELPRKVVFNESASVSPAFNDLQAYSANGTLGLAVPVFRQFSVSTNVVDSFIDNPSPGYHKNSLQWTTGLTYTLK